MEHSNKLAVTSFLRQYGLVAFFGILGIVFILIGLYQSFSGPSEEIVFDDVVEEEIFVDINGAVINPGVYPLSSLSRMKDAVIAAGGLHVDADREYLAKQVNMARVVEDGEKIYIPFVGEVGEMEEEDVTLGAQEESVGLVNLNSATESELDELPGVGPVTAEKIIDGRPYGSVEELSSRDILGPATYEDVKDLVEVE